MPSLVSRVPTWALAALGVLALAGAGGHAAVPALVWLAPIPWLLWSRRARGWLPWLAMAATLFVALTAQLATIITDPIPWAFAPAFAAPMALTLFLVFRLVEALRRATGDTWFLYGYASLAALSDVSSGAFGPTGSWGTASAGLTDDLVLLQLASLFGIGGIGFLVAWVAAFLTTLLDSPAPRTLLPHGVALGAALLAATTYGTWRLSQPSSGPTVPVAAVVTDLGLSTEGLPPRDALAAEVDAMFDRTERAADRGARLIVWNEGATAVFPEDEAALLERASDTARRLDVDLVVAWIRVTGEDPLTFENKAMFLDNRGELLTTYHKRHPVPGETEPSDNPVPRLERPYGTVSMGICYDHDFPEMSRAHAAVGAGLVALPASDWAGIDPVHTLMARVRAIEGGFSTVRAVRASASAAFDDRGRVRGWMSVEEDNDRVMVTDVPTTPRRTLYATVGDWPMVLPGGVVLGWIVIALVGVMRRRGSGRMGAAQPRPPTRGH